MSVERVVKEAERKRAWLKELTEFIAEANLQTWAAGKGEELPTRTGHKRHVYEKGVWRLDDEYRGYFRAPGETVVFYKEMPSWTMAYSGVGMMEGWEHMAKDTFSFLRSALKKVTPESPFRGPPAYSEGEWKYFFDLEHGNITDYLWRESIYNGNDRIFTQVGTGGIVIHRDRDYLPLLPWDRY